MRLSGVRGDPLTILLCGAGLLAAIGFGVSDADHGRQVLVFWTLITAVHVTMTFIDWRVAGLQPREPGFGMRQLWRIGIVEINAGISGFNNVVYIKDSTTTGQADPRAPTAPGGPSPGDLPPRRRGGSSATNGEALRRG